MTIGSFMDGIVGRKALPAEAPVAGSMPIGGRMPMGEGGGLVPWMPNPQASAPQGPEFIGGNPPAPEPLPPDAQPSFAPDDFRQMPQPDAQMFGNQPQSAYGRQTLGNMAPGKFGQWWGSSFGRGGR